MTWKIKLPKKFTSSGQKTYLTRLNKGLCVRCGLINDRKILVYCTKCRWERYGDLNV